MALISWGSKLEISMVGDGTEIVKFIKVFFVNFFSFLLNYNYFTSDKRKTRARRYFQTGAILAIPFAGIYCTTGFQYKRYCTLFKLLGTFGFGLEIQNIFCTVRSYIGTYIRSAYSVHFNYISGSIKKTTFAAYSIYIHTFCQGILRLSNKTRILVKLPFCNRDERVHLKFVLRDDIFHRFMALFIWCTQDFLSSGNLPI